MRQVFRGAAMFDGSRLHAGAAPADPGVAAFWAMLRPHTTRFEVRRNEVLLRAGEVSRRLLIVEQGCLRLAYNHDGRDLTLQFFTAGQAVASFVSLREAEPSLFDIEAAAPGLIRAVEGPAVLALWDKDAAFRDAIVELLVARVNAYQALFLSRIAETPEQRYRALIAQSPEIVTLVAQHHIASYLGVTPVSLSRIRKRVQNDNKG